MSAWSFAYDGYRPEEEGRRETLCTLGNGFFATRGAAPESVDDGIHYPGTYIAGLYNRLRSNVDGVDTENEDLVNLPNWLPLSFRVAGGEWLNLDRCEILDYHQELDLRQGLLHRNFRFRDPAGNETSVRSERFVHMEQEHLAGLRTTIRPENWSGQLEVRSALDGRVVNNGVLRYRRLNNLHLEHLHSEAFSEEAMWLQVRTNQSRVEVSLAARTRVRVNGETCPVDHVAAEEGYVAQHFTVPVQQGQHVTIEKLVALYSSRDHSISESGLAARTAVRRLGDWDDVIRGHILAWKHLWRRCDIAIEDGRDTLRILRLHIFHLLQTASPHTAELDVGIPARGWHGEAYRGHIFWDELFIFPFLNFRLPELTRALLLYRYHRLGEARAHATESGFRGALFPWQGGSDGREETPDFYFNPLSGRWITDNSDLQRHINGAIAYNIWQYMQVTGDHEFLYYYGAEMFFEIARFFANAATYNPGLERYEIAGVVGADEFHDALPGASEPGLRNNAYTNILASWVLWRALDIFRMLPSERREELSTTLLIGQDELQRWDEVSRKLRVVFHADGVISQFEGYESLAEFDWEAYRNRYSDIARLDLVLEAQGDSPNNYRASKQADVLMIFYLFSAAELRELFDRLGYPFEEATMMRNSNFYLPRTSHGSTLSRLVHAWVVCCCDDTQSWSLFDEALMSDVADTQGGTTREGIHLGAMAGTVDIVQRGFTGIEARDNVLWFNPSLPPNLKCISVRLRYRQHLLNVDLYHDRIRVESHRDAPESIDVGIRGEVIRIAPGGVLELAL